MERVFRTREEARKKIQEWTSWGVASLVGAGVALSLSIIFLVAGVSFILLGIAVGLVGWGLSFLLPVILPSRAIECPHCRSINRVLPHVNEFACIKCAHFLKVSELAGVREAA